MVYRSSLKETIGCGSAQHGEYSVTNRLILRKRDSKGDSKGGPKCSLAN